MAIRATDGRVRGADEGKAGVVLGQARGRKREGGVACLTVLREALVIQGARRCHARILRVTRGAGQGVAREGAIAFFEVALLAGDDGVPAAQRELGAAMCLDREERMPVLLRMTRLAEGAEFLHVRVGVAGGTALRCRRGPALRVTRDATDPGVLACQRVSGALVGEARGDPPLGCVARIATHVFRMSSPSAHGRGVLLFVARGQCARPGARRHLSGGVGAIGRRARIRAPYEGKQAPPPEEHGRERGRSVGESVHGSHGANRLKDPSCSS